MNMDTKKRNYLACTVELTPHMGKCYAIRAVKC